MIDPDNEQLGILELEEALTQAEDLGLDLVEVSPTSDPPVCMLGSGQRKVDQYFRAYLYCQACTGGA